MRLTQGTFSFLPDFTPADTRAQIEYALAQHWACAVEYTDDPHPRNTYWEMWAAPMFDSSDAGEVLAAAEACVRAHPRGYVKVNAFDSTRGVESTRLSFIVHRPAHEPGFRLAREQGPGRSIRYQVSAYATDAPQGERY